MRTAEVPYIRLLELLHPLYSGRIASAHLPIAPSREARLEAERSMNRTLSRTWINHA
jgi:hypothetical protein